MAHNRDTTRRTTSKPIRPRNFPLTPHVRGGWAKKYKGKYLYIAEREPGKALEEFHRRAREIDTGHAILPPPKVEGATVGEIAKRYLAERKADNEAGKLSVGSLADYAASAKLMVQVLGKDTLVTDLIPDDFTRLFRTMSHGRKSHALARMVQNVRTLWNHAEENGWIDRRPRFGSTFKKPQTEKKAGHPPAARDVRILIRAAKGQLRAMILLGINAGYQAADCSALTPDAIDLKSGVIHFPRVKMKGRRPIDRVATLWPETIDALKAVLAERPGDELVFRTVRGKVWVRSSFSKKGKDSSINGIGQEYRKLCARLKIKANRFGDLRVLHRTIADELERPHAAARLMGHRLMGLADVYVSRIEHDRIRQVTDHIRKAVMNAKSTRRSSRALPTSEGRAP